MFVPQTSANISEVTTAVSVFLCWRCPLICFNTPEDTETGSVFLSCVYCYNRLLFFLLFWGVFPFFYSHFLSFPSVKPNTPEKLMLNITWNKNLPYLRVSWEPPQKADTRSGWITLIYELRTKLEGEDEWEVSEWVVWLAKLFVFQMYKLKNFI